MTSDVLALEDCYTIVKNYINSENFRVISFKTSNYFDEVNGFLGEHVLLETEVDIDGEKINHRFFLKRFPYGHQQQGEYLKSMDGWAREIYFYETLLPNLKGTLPGYTIDFVPQYLLGKLDDIMVFEDLSLKNYHMPRKPSLNLLDEDHICLILKTLAKYHAGCLAFEEYKSAELGYEYRLFSGDEKLIQEPLVRREDGFLGYAWVKGGVKALDALLAKVAPSGLSVDALRQKFRILVDKALNLMKHQTKFRNVVCKGDMWAKNVMYKYIGDSTQPIEALLVDFQLIRYHVPAHDVLLFLSLTTDSAFRQRKFSFFMKYYHNHLKEELEKLQIAADDIQMSFDDYLKSVSYIMPEIKLQGALQRLQQCGSKEFFIKLLNDKEEFIKFVFVDKTPFALELFDSDSNFRALLTEAVEELIETSQFPAVFREDCYRILEDELGTTTYELVGYKVTKYGKNEGSLHVLDIEVLFNRQSRKLSFLVKSEEFDFARVVKKIK